MRSKRWRRYLLVRAVMARSWRRMIFPPDSNLPDDSRAASVGRMRGPNGEWHDLIDQTINRCT